MVLTVDVKATRNAIDRALARSIADAIGLAEQDGQVRGIVITGVGPTFLSGADLNMLAALPQARGGGAEVLGMFDDLAACERCNLPVAAAVQGDVFGGGCELLLLCDFVIIEEHVQLAFRHVKMGLSPAWGGTSRLVERVGPLEATRLLLTGEKISAAEALRIGLANDVVPRGAARDLALARVARIADNPRTTVAAMKRTLREVREARRGAEREREREAFSERWGDADHQRAMDAFRSRK
jgi:enoyl-CoA hydratase/carnithine racemase